MFELMESTPNPDAVTPPDITAEEVRVALDIIPTYVPENSSPVDVSLA
jgi:hypothetical protein